MLPALLLGSALVALSATVAFAVASPPRRRETPRQLHAGMTRPPSLAFLDRGEPGRSGIRACTECGRVVDGLQYHAHGLSPPDAGVRRLRVKRPA